MSHKHTHVQALVLFVFMTCTINATTRASLASGVNELGFVENQGQWKKDVLYKATVGDVIVAITSSNIEYYVPVTNRSIKPVAPASFDQRADQARTIVDYRKITLSYVGGSSHFSATGEGKKNQVCNYYLNNDPEGWRTQIPCYQSVIINELYPGVDLYFILEDSTLRYEYHVSPSSTSHEISVAYTGIDSLGADAAGNLLVFGPGFSWSESTPIFLEIGSRRPFSSSTFSSIGTSEATILIPTHQEIGQGYVIDPELRFSTYHGGGGSDEVYQSVVGQSNELWVTGSTFSSDFPVSGDAYDDTYTGNRDIFISRFSSDGSLLYCTFFGGGGIDEARGISYDGGWTIRIVGYTHSTNFPMINPIDSIIESGGQDAIYVEIESVFGVPTRSSYWGGSEQDDGIGIIGSTITGYTFSQDFTLVNPADPTFDNPSQAEGFVTKFTGGTVAFSTYLGGSGIDAPLGIAFDGTSYYVTGYTSSVDFPVVSAWDATHNGGYDVFITKVNSSGNQITNSTYFGGSGNDYASAIDVNYLGRAYVCGVTRSSDLPVHKYDSTYNGNTDAFFAKYQSGSISAGYLGGSSYDSAASIRCDAQDNFYITGSTLSTDFPVLRALDSSLNTFSGGDVFISTFGRTANTLLTSTFIGGPHDDYGATLSLTPSRLLYVSGGTKSSSFPVLNAADPTYNQLNNTIYDGFVLKYSCCVGLVGDVNMSGGDPDLSDLSRMTAIVTSGGEIICWAETDMNQSGNVDLSDLSLLVSYLSTTPRPQLMNCPDN